MTFLRRVSLIGAAVLCACLFSTPLAVGATLRSAGSPCPGPGAAVTDPATSITTTTAVLNGHYAFAAGGISFYDYGLTTEYGMHVTLSTPGAGSSTPDPKTISGLTPGTLYHFRDGRVGIEGCDLTFTTLSLPSPSTPAPPAGS